MSTPPSCPPGEVRIGGFCCGDESGSTIADKQDEHSKCNIAGGNWLTSCTCHCGSANKSLFFVGTSWKCAYEVTIYQNCFLSPANNSNVAWMPHLATDLGAINQGGWKVDCLGNNDGHINTLVPTDIERQEYEARARNMSSAASAQETMQILYQCASSSSSITPNMQSFIDAVENNTTCSGTLEAFKIYLE